MLKIFGYWLKWNEQGDNVEGSREGQSIYMNYVSNMVNIDDALWQDLGISWRTQDPGEKVKAKYKKHT
jgi:hypothetical protein